MIVALIKKREHSRFKGSIEEAGRSTEEVAREQRSLKWAPSLQLELFNSLSLLRKACHPQHLWYTIVNVCFSCNIKRTGTVTEVRVGPERKRARSARG